MISAEGLTEGTAVEVHSLRSSPQHNGKHGEVVRFNTTSGRWEVRLTSSGKVLALKPDNLTPLAVAPEPSSDDEEAMYGYSQKKIRRMYQEIIAILVSNTTAPNKLCLDPSGMVCKGKFGGISLFDGVLEDQVGFMDVILLRGIYTEHVLSHDSHDTFSSPNKENLVCTPASEFFFIVGKDGIDMEKWKLRAHAQPTLYADCLVEGRNAKTISELMKSEQCRRAGLRAEEMVALRLYTGMLLGSVLH